VLQHSLGVEVGNEEGDIISLWISVIGKLSTIIWGRECTDWDGFPPQHDKALRTLHHESGELVTQDPFDFICLFDLDRYPDGIDRRFDEHPFVFIPGDG
jgi:hypothetical protein